MILIKNHLDSFSKGQKLIANYILKNWDKAAFMTAAKLGITVGVSESTVVRFAVELGYAGYPALQKSMLEIIRNRLTTVQRIEIIKQQIHTPEDALDKVLSNDIDTIKKTIEEISSKAFTNALDAIISSKIIYIIGVGSSSALARFLYFYFNIMFTNVKLIYTTSSSELFEYIFKINKEDCIIGISFPRYSKITIKAFKYASSQNAKTIAITNSKNSPLVEFSNHLLLAKSDTVSFVDSLVAPLSLINALIIALAIKKSDQIIENFNIIENIWDEYEIYEKLEDKPHDS